MNSDISKIGLLGIRDFEPVIGPCAADVVRQLAIESGLLDSNYPVGGVMVTVQMDLEIPLAQCESDRKLYFLNKLIAASRDTRLDPKDRDAITQFMASELFDRNQSSAGLLDYSGLMQAQVHLTRQFIWVGALGSKCEALLDTYRKQMDREAEKQLHGELLYKRMEALCSWSKTCGNQGKWEDDVIDLVTELCASGLRPKQQFELVRKLISKINDVGSRAAQSVQHQYLRVLTHIANAHSPTSELKELLLEMVREYPLLKSARHADYAIASLNSALSQISSADYPEVISALHVAQVEQFEVISSEGMHDTVPLQRYLFSLNQAFAILSSADAKKVRTMLRTVMAGLSGDRASYVVLAWRRFEQLCNGAGVSQDP